MAVTNNTIKEVGTLFSNLAAKRLEEHIRFVSSIDSSPPSDVITASRGYQNGDTINISLPPRLEAKFDDFDQTGKAAQDLDFDTVPLTLDKTLTIKTAINNFQLTTDISREKYLAKVLDESMHAMANKIDNYVAGELMVNCPVGYGDGTTFALDPTTLVRARNTIYENGVGIGTTLAGLINADSDISAVGLRSSNFNPQSTTGKQVLAGSMNDIMTDGINYYTSFNTPTHVNGTDDTFAVKTTVTTEGSTTLAVSGLTATTGTVTKGTIIKIAGCKNYDLNKRAAGYRDQTFVVTADATADGSGDATLQIYPKMATGGTTPYVATLPQAAQVITILGAASAAMNNNMIIHKDAARIILAPLAPIMTKEQQTFVSNGKYGSVRMMLEGDFNTGMSMVRFDLLLGMAVIRGQQMARILTPTKL